MSLQWAMKGNVAMSIEEAPKVDPRVLQAPDAPFFASKDPVVAGTLRNSVWSIIAALLNVVIIGFSNVDPAQFATWPDWLKAAVPLIQFVGPILGRAIEAQLVDKPSTTSKTPV